LFLFCLGADVVAYLTKKNAEKDALIEILHFKLSIESSVSCSHKEIFARYTQNIHHGLDIVFQGIPPVPMVVINDLWETASSINFTPDGDKESPHQKLLEELISHIISKLQLLKLSQLRFVAKPTLPTMTKKVPDIGIFAVNNLSQSFKSALVLGEVEGTASEKYNEGVGQAISYSARMLKARQNNNVVFFYCTALNIEIMRRKITMDLKGSPNDVIFSTGILPLWHSNPLSACTPPSEGFSALVRLLSADPIALDSSIPTEMGPASVELSNNCTLLRKNVTYKLLGHGGFSEVFHTTLNGAEVAIKVTAPDLVRHETKVLSQLNSFDIEGKFFIRLHSLSGADSNAMILTPVGTPLQNALINLAAHNLDVQAVEDQVRACLGALHSQHLVHLDCGRATNYIIVNRTVIMIDFGLAASVGELRTGLVGVRCCAADVVCRSEFSGQVWTVQTTLDDEALQYLLYVVKHEGLVFESSI
jgi:predicted Ser/Thr protein kinase